MAGTKKVARGKSGSNGKPYLTHHVTSAVKDPLERPPQHYDANPQEPSAHSSWWRELKNSASADRADNGPERSSPDWKTAEDQDAGTHVLVSIIARRLSQHLDASC